MMISLGLREIFTNYS